MRTQEFKIKVDEGEAVVRIKVSGWLRRKIEVEYDLSRIPRQLRRRTYSALEAHVVEKLRKRAFEFHVHLHTQLI